MGLVGDYFSRFYVKFFGICPRVCLKYVAIMRIHFTIQHTKDYSEQMLTSILPRYGLCQMS